MARVAFFRGNSISTSDRETLYTHFVYTVPNMARVAFLEEILYLLQIEKRCTLILYTPFLIWLE